MNLLCYISTNSESKLTVGAIITLAQIFVLVLIAHSLAMHLFAPQSLHNHLIATVH